MIVVHHLNDSRSQRVLWLLEELNLNYRIQHYQRDPVTRLAPPELKAVHPLGKAPVIVCNDADIDAVVQGVRSYGYYNAGQDCTAACRIYAQAGIHDRLVSELGDAVASLRFARKKDADNELGPLISARQRDRVQGYLDLAVAEGGSFACGGRRPPGLARGYFIEPTVIRGLTNAARVAREEIFGPVAPITTFRTEAEVVSAANATEYGLVAYVFTRDNARVIRVSEALDFGMVGINQGIVSNPAAPFGGVKHSGFGREGGFEGIEEYLETKYVGIAL